MNSSAIVRPMVARVDIKRVDAWIDGIKRSADRASIMGVEPFRPENYRLLILREAEAYRSVWGRLSHGKVYGVKYKVITVQKAVSQRENTIAAIARYLKELWSGEKLVIACAGDTADWADTVLAVLEDLWTGEIGNARPRVDKAVYKLLVQKLIGNQAYLNWKCLGKVSWDFYYRKGFTNWGCTEDLVIGLEEYGDKHQEILVTSVEEFYQLHPNARISSIESDSYGYLVSFVEDKSEACIEDSSGAYRADSAKLKKYGVGAVVGGKVMWLKDGGGVTFHPGQVAIFDRESAETKASGMTRNSRNGYKWKTYKV